jgi:hypothetical protein
MNKSDTTPEARLVQIELYRRMTPAQKFRLICDAYETGKLLSMAGIRLQYPDATERDVWQIWAKRHLGEELYNKVYGNRKDG